jgi:hypothetical protein
MESFWDRDGRGQHEAFLKWLDENPEGFLINCRTASDMMLHGIAPLLRSNGLDVQFRQGTERRIIITNGDGPQDHVTADGAHMRIRPPHKDSA